MIALTERRGALAALGLIALAALSGCAPAGPPSAEAPGPSGVKIGSVVVNTAPLTAQSGDTTAQWAQQAVTAAAAQRLAGDMAPGDPAARTLTLRINSIVLGTVGPDGTATDWIRGTATLNGAPVPIRATTTYTPMSVDTALWEQALQGRVQTASQAFVYTVRRNLGL